MSQDRAMVPQEDPKYGAFEKAFKVLNAAKKCCE